MDRGVAAPLVECHYDTRSRRGAAWTAAVYRNRSADAEGAGPDGHQDILTCGVCQKPFALSDIVRFIQHKVASCNKENFGQCFAAADRERDNEDGALPLSTINTRRPSISAPISGKKGSGSRVHTPPPASPRLPAPGDLCVDGAASSTPKRRASASPLTSSSLEDGEDIKPDIKQERMDTTEESSQCKKSRTEFADAESNTTHSGEYEKWTPLAARSLCFIKRVSTAPGGETPTCSSTLNVIGALFDLPVDRLANCTQLSPKQLRQRTRLGPEAVIRDVLLAHHRVLMASKSALTTVCLLSLSPSCVPLGAHEGNDSRRGRTRPSLVRLGHVTRHE
ncbi:hypothetical protein GEV33_012548 [Tenebrio molitor]|uniref:BCL-11A-like CCHC zinc finger domain-containing protein n=1 Tax=Tenebrio molitor TaxID=7067 RepID=A0A8J6H8V2_TENMO|nr:hypothetical protein GEV33_012548 [Tenebrio molitor]